MVYGGERAGSNPCNKLACPVCRYAWSARHAQRIRDGYRDGMQFVTLTFRYSPGQPVDPFKALHAFRLWRRSVNAPRGAGNQFHFYRAIELTKQWSTHIHMVVDPGVLPHTPTIGKREGALRWLARCSPESREYGEWLQKKFGFGFIYDCTPVRHGAGGAANYLTKSYLSKVDSKQFRTMRFRLQGYEIAGRRLRVAEGSHNWHPIGAQHTYAIGEIIRDDDLDGSPPHAMVDLPLHPDARRQEIARRKAYWREQWPTSELILELKECDLEVARSHSRVQAMWNKLARYDVYQWTPPTDSMDDALCLLLDTQERLLIEREDEKARREYCVAKIRLDGYRGPLYYLREEY